MHAAAINQCHECKKIVMCALLPKHLGEGRAEKVKPALTAVSARPELLRDACHSPRSGNVANLGGSG